MTQKARLRIQLGGLWRNPDFVKLWVAQTISLLGSSVSFLALPLIAVSLLKATPFQMGVFNTMSTLPALLLGLFAGVWVDRHRRRPLLIATNLGQALLLVVISGATVLHLLRMEHLYVVAFCIAVFKLFFDVADQSFLPALVGREQLVEGNSKLEISRSAVSIAGPGLAGVLIQLLTAPLAILFDAASFIISALGISAIRVTETITSVPQHEQSMRHAIGAGLRLVLGNHALRALTGALSTLTLFSAMVDAVLLIYLTRELHLTAGLIGLIFGCGSVGFMVGALLQGWTLRRVGLRTTLIVGLLLTGFGDMLIPLVNGAHALFLILFVLFAAQFCFGLGRTTFSISQMSLRQRITPDHMQGRMNATIRFVSAGFIAVGGLLGEALSVQWTLVLAAVGEMLASIWLLTARQPLTSSVAVDE